MKKMFLMMLVVAGNVFAFQPQFQIDYTNHAWGFVNQGCLIDREGNVYQYRYGQVSDGKGLVPAGKMSDADLKFALELAEKAAQGKFSQRIAAADAGTTEWTARTEWGQEVKLKTSGDWEGLNDSPATQDLLKLLNGLCIVQN